LSLLLLQPVFPDHSACDAGDRQFLELGLLGGQTFPSMGFRTTLPKSFEALDPDTGGTNAFARLGELWIEFGEKDSCALKLDATDRDAVGPHGQSLSGGTLTCFVRQDPTTRFEFLLGFADQACTPTSLLFELRESGSGSTEFELANAQYALESKDEFLHVASP